MGVLPARPTSHRELAACFVQLDLEPVNGHARPLPRRILRPHGGCNDLDVHCAHASATADGSVSV